MKINIYDFDEEELNELPIKQKIKVKKKPLKKDENPDGDDNYEKPIRGKESETNKNERFVE